MESLGLIWPSLVLLMMYAVIGGAPAWLIGLRGLWAVGAAPAFATTVIGIASAVAGWTGMRWSLLPVVLTAIVIVAGIAIARRLSRSRLRERTPVGGGWWTVASLVVAGAALALVVVRVLGAPDAISQTFDNIFHLNAIRYMLDTGVASPLEIGQMTSPGGGVPFYPAVWHAVAAIVVQLTGVAIPVAVNAQTLVIAAVVWPVGAVLLARVLLGATRTVTVSAAIVAAAVPAFPLLPMDYGVLYPYQLALSLLPVTLAATARLLRVGTGSTAPAPGWWALVLAGAVPGIALAHPGGFVAWLALTMPMCVLFGTGLWRRHPAVGHRIWIGVSFVAYLAGGLLLLKALRPPSPTRGWATGLDVATALGRALSVTLYYPAASWLVAIALLAGLIWTIRERRRGPVIAAAIWAIGALLYVVAVSLPWATLRDALTGSWYNNWQRLAALFAVALLPLATWGLARTTEHIVAYSRRWRIAPVRRTAAAVVAAAVVFAFFHLQAMPSAIHRADDGYRVDERSPLLSADEYALLLRLDDSVPEGTAVAGSPYTGSSLAYAISDRRVLMPHALMDISDDLSLINRHLRDADEDPRVCDVLQRLDVGFVLDFGSREVHGEKHAMPGLADLADSSAVRLVDRQGDARLYEVTACG